MNQAMHHALRWMQDHGGDAAVARTASGGRNYLAQGEIGPFQPSTAKKLVDAGLAEFEYLDGKQRRFRLTPAGRATK